MIGFNLTLPPIFVHWQKKDFMVLFCFLLLCLALVYGSFVKLFAGVLGSPIKWKNSLVLGLLLASTYALFYWDAGLWLLGTVAIGQLRGYAPILFFIVLLILLINTYCFKLFVRPASKGRLSWRKSFVLALIFVCLDCLLTLAIYSICRQ